MTAWLLVGAVLLTSALAFGIDPRRWAFRKIGERNPSGPLSEKGLDSI